MRQTRLLMLSVLIMLCCRQTVAAEESSWGWMWPFGHDEQAAEPLVPSTDAATEAPAARPPSRTTDRAAMKQSRRGHRVSTSERSWPDFEVPKPHMPQFWASKPEVDDARNAWTGKSIEPENASPWQVVTEGTQRLGESARKAWHKTVDALTPDSLSADDRPAPRVAQRAPIWKRALGLGEEEPEGPQTVTEWMSQERLNP